jgi:hypothetical protein
LREKQRFFKGKRAENKRTAKVDEFTTNKYTKNEKKPCQ